MSEQTKFKVGDRVRVYGHWRNSDNIFTSYLRGSDGTVTELLSDDELLVRLDTDEENEVHPKQCRKLKPKKKPLRVEGTCEWVAVFDGEMPLVAPISDGIGLDYADLDPFIGKRTKITVEVIDE